MYILDVITETNIHITTRPIPPRQYHSTEQGVARVQKTSATHELVEFRIHTRYKSVGVRGEMTHEVHWIQLQK